MSASLVQKALEIVDPEFRKQCKSKVIFFLLWGPQDYILDKKTKNSKNVFNLMPESQKITKNITRKGRKGKIMFFGFLPN